jgi:hypothetical protein
MNFEGDAFISYAHLDNLELVEGRKGWVANFHRALEVRVSQFLGKSPHIWRDPKLAGNDLFAETLLERLKRVAVLVSIVTPRYLKSEWTLREFNEFVKSAEEQGGLKVRDKARVFKVLKQPVPLDKVPPELRAILGYEFFSTDPETGKVRELDEVFGPEAQREFWLRLDDLAHDLVGLLEALEADAQLAPFVPDTMPQPAAPAAASPAASVPAPESASRTQQPAALPQPTAKGGNGATRAIAPSKATVYLAETTGDVREQRESLRRDLQQQGFRVLPDMPIPHDQIEALPLIRSALAESRMAIHLFGRNYGVVPEGATQSIAELQHELATERAGQGRFSRLLWIHPGLQVDDSRQKALLDKVRVDPRIGNDADMLETPFEDLRTAVMDWLARDLTPPAVEAPPPGVAPQVYFMADVRDADRLGPWSDALFGENLEIIHPIFEGDESEIREFHEETLSTCDACVIFYGSGNELWLRRKLREIQKSPGYGRTKPLPFICIVQIAPHTPEKDRFRTHEATVVPQWDGVSLDSLRPFIAQVKAGRSA